MDQWLVRFLLKKCWEDIEVRRLLQQLLHNEVQDQLCSILEEIAMYCLGESDDLPSI
jgi:hypothetical protein